MAASVLRLAAVVLALRAAAPTMAVSPQHGSGEDSLDCGSRLLALATCKLPDQPDADPRGCCAAILAFHTAGCMWCADVCVVCVQMLEVPRPARSRVLVCFCVAPKQTDGLSAQGSMASLRSFNMLCRCFAANPMRRTPRLRRWRPRPCWTA